VRGEYRLNCNFVFVVYSWNKFKDDKVVEGTDLSLPDEMGL
jgi:hypothetical protein